MEDHPGQTRALGTTRARQVVKGLAEYAAEAALEVGYADPDGPGSFNRLTRTRTLAGDGKVTREPGSRYAALSKAEENLSPVIPAAWAAIRCYGRGVEGARKTVGYRNVRQRAAWPNGRRELRSLWVAVGHGTVPSDSLPRPSRPRLALALFRSREPRGAAQGGDAERVTRGVQEHFPPRVRLRICGPGS